MKDRRITKPQHVRQVLAEQVNMLRQLETELKTPKEKQDNARTITYINNTILTAMRDGESLEKMYELEAMLKEVLDFENKFK